MNLLVFEMPQPEYLPLPFHNNLLSKDGYPEPQKTKRRPKTEQ